VAEDNLFSPSRQNVLEIAQPVDLKWLLRALLDEKQDSYLVCQNLQQAVFTGQILLAVFHAVAVY
jgi:hypothetical protein